MIVRANYFELSSGAIQILQSQEAYLQEQFTDSEIITVPIWELVKLRVSQINQCAFCIDMHTKVALSNGETKERIFGLNAWRDMPLYSDIELTALDWAERLIAAEQVNDKYYQKVTQILGEKNIVDLTIAVNAICSWNRMAKTFKTKVGSF